MEYSTLAYSENDGILHVRLNRPEKRNAMNRQMFIDIGHFFSETASQPGIDAVLISGEGKCFSAGTDLASFDQDAIGHADSRFVRLVQQAYSEIEALEKAVIALIHGHCIGIGLELALSCDLRICSDDALFSIPEVQLGLIPDDGGCQRLPHVIGLGRAKEMILTGRTINAEKAEKWGLVNDVVPTPEMQRTGLKWAQEIKKKRAFRRGAGQAQHRFQPERRIAFGTGACPAGPEAGDRRLILSEENRTAACRER